MTNAIEKLIGKSISVMPQRCRNYYYYQMLRNTVFPEIVHIESTNACNAKCIMCARDTMRRKVGFMDFGLFRKIIDECCRYRELKEAHLHGFGEPLMDQMLIDRIRYAKLKKVKKVYFVTNASLLNKEFSRSLISSGLDMIKFSVYGNSTQTYEAIHKGLKFDSVEKNILGFLDARKSAGFRKPAVKIQFLPQEINMHERSAFFSKWSSLIDKSCKDSVEEFSMHNWIYGRQYCNKQSVIREKKSCGIPFVSLQLLWNGDVTACCYDYEGKMNFGNCNRMSIFEIWNGPEFSNFRNLHRTFRFAKLNVCKVCDQLR